MEDLLIGIWNCITHPYILSGLIFTLIIWSLDNIKIGVDRK